MVFFNPLDLPEIRSRFATYLDKPDLARCIRVSWGWHDSFAPLVWRKVVVHDGYNVKTTEHVPLAALQRYRNLIADLDIQGQNLGTYAMKYPNLRTLRLHDSAESWTYPHSKLELTDDKDPVAFVTHNPHLVKLKLGSMGVYLRADFWDAVSRLRYLKELQLDRADFPCNAMGAFLNACKQLECLEVRVASIVIKDIDVIKAFPQMRRLKLEPMFELGAKDELLLVNRCPQLKTLCWGAGDSDDIAQVYFDPYVERVDWSSVENLNLQVHVSDQNLALILNGMQTLITLDIFGKFEERAFQALRRHFKSLTRLNVGTRYDMTSAMLREILCSCPGLEELGGALINIEEVVEDGPWVCLSLKSLSVIFRVLRSKMHLTKVIKDRASTLTRLERDVRICFSSIEL